MPVKPLPKTLIQRLQKTHSIWGKKRTAKTIKRSTNIKTLRGRVIGIVTGPPKIVTKRIKKKNSAHVFDKLTIIDPRINSRKKYFPTNEFYQEFGLRVREMDISRNYPEVKKVVLKRMHIGETFTRIKKRLSILFENYKTNPPKNYLLIKPIFYRIDRQTIAMSKSNIPSLRDFFPGPHQLGLSFLKPKNSKAKKFYEKLKAKHGLTDLDFISAVQELDIRDRRTINISFGNYALVGVENKKFVFMPFADTV